MLKRIEWQKVQVWQPMKYVPYDCPTCILYFPEDIDMDAAEEAVNMVTPVAVLPPTQEDFEAASMSSFNLLGLAPSTGMIMQGQHGKLNERIKWAHSHGYAPIVLHPGNFYGGSGGQDKTLWQMHQGDSVFDKGAWYHLATSRPAPYNLPGRWTLGGDFVGNNSYGQS
jgi:hypothetical protein